MIYAICNPVAGGGLGLRVGRQVEEFLKKKGVPFEFHLTERPGHAIQLARAAGQSGADTVLSIGGDGTALDVARGIYGSGSALGVIPAGTGNDFIKALKTPKEPMKALEHILSHPAVPTDVGWMNGQLFLNEIGAGFDVAVLDGAETFKKRFRGLLPYLLGLLRALFRFKPFRVTYTLDDGQPVTQDAFVVAAANGGIIGGGIPIAPDAKVDDGQLDVVVVGPIKKTRMLSRLVGLMKGKILSFPETRFVRVAAVKFSAKGMRVNTDGEVSPIDAVDAKLLPGGLLIHR